MNWGSYGFTTGVFAMAKRTFAYACSLASLTAILVASVSLPSLAPAQTRGPTDPGVRSGAPGAGDPIPGLTAQESAFFKAAKDVFEETENVEDGLGPRFNLDSCVGCHAQPSSGGSSPPVNPQVAVATAQGAKNTLPSFIRADGPVREVRFVRNPDGSPDGGVHALFVITGRSDAQGCSITQPNFAAAVASNNAVFRIPTPTFGLGLVEAVTDTALQTSMAANSQQKRALGISGRFNISGNDQTITRFGWKAQNKSLLIFSGEASNVEMGVSNENFPNERTDGNGQCSPNPEPEDQVIVPPDPTDPNHRDIPAIFSAFGKDGVASDISSDIENFAVFMRLNASPSQCNYNSGVDANGFARCLALDASAQRGAKIFGSLDPNLTGSLASPSPDTNPNTANIKTIGCVLCHSNFLRTTTSATPELNNAVFHPFSDFAIHTMDSGLADGVTQGNAGGDQFRTAPLWGLGQRLFFLHDGRTSNVLTAIKDH